MCDAHTIWVGGKGGREEKMVREAKRKIRKTESNAMQAMPPCSQNAKPNATRSWLPAAAALLPQILNAGRMDKWEEWGER